MHFHGGAFVGRNPRQDDHICSYVASEVGMVVVSVDYDVAPQVTYPVAEEEAYDVVCWIHQHGAGFGWDPTRISVGGVSSGGKLAINVAQLAHRDPDKDLRLTSIIAAYAVADVSRADRKSPALLPRINRLVQRLPLRTYWTDETRRLEPLASPLYDPHLVAALPSTLILTGTKDTLAPEMDEIAHRIQRASGSVSHHSFDGADHGFTNSRPLATARAAVRMIGEFLDRTRC